MAEIEQKSFDLATFARAKEKMIATNDAAYNNKYNKQFRSRVKDYTPEEVERIINSGSLIEQQTLSRNYYYKDGFYKQIINYYATLLKNVGILIPNPSFGKSLSTPAINKRYVQALDYLEKMSIPTLLTNCSLRALIDGCYYGIITKLDKNVFTVLDLPAQYCCSRFKDIYGNDIIEFDVTYFNTITDLTERKNALSVYPKAIRTAYNLYQNNGKIDKRWVVVPSDVGICFPLFDGRPIFLDIIPATIQYDEAVETERVRDLDEIRKVIVQQIPHLTDGRLLFEPDEAEEIHNGTVGMLKSNPNISVLTTYADVDSIQSQTTSDASRQTTLKQMLQHVYATSGTSGEIFASTGSSTLPTSIKKDLALMMVLGNKYSVFITNIINSIYQNGNISFKYMLLPVSYYNETEYIDESFKLAQSGYSFLLPAIALGLSQKDLGNLKDLENDVLILGEKLRPLSSAYTQSGGDEEGGRPKKSADEKSEKTQENEKSLDNQVE